jgi:hypothetical protein
VKDDDAKQSIKNRVLDNMIQSDNESHASFAHLDEKMMPTLMKKWNFNIILVMK